MNPKPRVELLPGGRGLEARGVCFDVTSGGKLPAGASLPLLCANSTGMRCPAGVRHGDRVFGHGTVVNISRLRRDSTLTITTERLYKYSLGGYYSFPPHGRVRARTIKGVSLLLQEPSNIAHEIVRPVPNAWSTRPAFDRSTYPCVRRARARSATPFSCSAHYAILI